MIPGDGNAERAALGGEEKQPQSLVVGSKRACLWGVVLCREAMCKSRETEQQGVPEEQQHRSQCPLRSAYEPAVARALC